MVGLADVTRALQRIDPVWEVLHPEEQRRVLGLLVEKITVSKERVEVRFRQRNRAGRRRTGPDWSEKQ